MHELSIALSIVAGAAEEATKHEHARIVSVHLRLGAYSGVVKEALLSAFELAREGTELAEAELVIEEVPLRVHCPKCQETRDVESMQLLACCACGTPAPELVSGRELDIVALELQ
ncbi:MAG: hydrogenase maturation nickel metallochaperone HypA [Gemmataceae bacterium]